MNLVCLTGTLERVREVRSGGGITFDIAQPVRRSGEWTQQRIGCVAWEATAEKIRSRFAEGEPIEVAGGLYQQIWTASDGTKRSTLQVTVTAVTRPPGTKPSRFSPY